MSADVTEWVYTPIFDTCDAGAGIAAKSAEAHDPSMQNAGPSDAFRAISPRLSPPSMGDASTEPIEVHTSERDPDSLAEANSMPVHKPPPPPPPPPCPEAGVRKRKGKDATQSGAPTSLVPLPPPPPCPEAVARKRKGKDAAQGGAPASKRRLHTCSLCHQVGHISPRCPHNKNRSMTTRLNFAKKRIEATLANAIEASQRGEGYSEAQKLFCTVRKGSDQWQAGTEVEVCRKTLRWYWVRALNHPNKTEFGIRLSHFYSEYALLCKAEDERKKA
jgi:hypothetical protein